MIANNKAWASAETVRREWLAGSLARKTAPKGAEAMICEAVVTGQHFLYKAMEANHPMLRTRLDHGAEKSRWDSTQRRRQHRRQGQHAQGRDRDRPRRRPQAGEATTGKHSWRNATGWDTRKLGALMEWGYQPSEVERILVGEEPVTEPVEANDDDEPRAENDQATDAA